MGFPLSATVTETLRADSDFERQRQALLTICQQTLPAYGIVQILREETAVSFAVPWLHTDLAFVSLFSLVDHGRLTVTPGVPYLTVSLSVSVRRAAWSNLGFAVCTAALAQSPWPLLLVVNNVLIYALAVGKAHEWLQNLLSRAAPRSPAGAAPAP